MNSKTLKVRNLIMNSYRLIMVVLLLSCAASALWAYSTYPEPEYISEDYISSSYTQYGEYSYFAKVSEPNPIHPVGHTLTHHTPAYFYTLSPNATIEFSCGFIPSDSADMDVEIDTKIILSAKSRQKDEASFWTKQYSIEKHRPVTLIDDEIHTQSFILYTEDIRGAINDIKKHLRYTQSASAEIVTCVTSEGTINDKKVISYREYTLPVSLETSYYQLPGEVRDEETIEKHASRKVLVMPEFLDKLITIAPPLLLLLIITCFFIYREHYFEPVSQKAIDQMKVEEEHAKVSDWISVGKFPYNVKVDLFDFVEIDSLTDIVNVSIDTNSRVIHDKGASIYFSMSGDVVYYFTY